MGNSNVKKYIIAVIIQVIILALYVVGNFFGFKVEDVVLNPLVYVIPFAVALICIDIILLIIIFRKRNKTVNDFGGSDE